MIIVNFDANGLIFKISISFLKLYYSFYKKTTLAPSKEYSILETIKVANSCMASMVR